MRIGIVVAMGEEAEPVIKALNLKDMGKTYKGEFNGNDVRLEVCGIGKINAMNSAYHLMNMYDCDIIYNIGTCGDLGNHGIGKVVLPNYFLDGDFDLSALGNTSKDPAEANYMDIFSVDSCISYSTFVTDARVKDCVVDMEAYGVASACSYTGTCFVAIKVTSDSADDNANESFNNNVSNVIEKNIEEIKGLLEDPDKTWRKVYEVK